jgi:hypothetical protein
VATGVLRKSPPPLPRVDGLSLLPWFQLIDLCFQFLLIRSISLMQTTMQTTDGGSGWFRSASPSPAPQCRLGLADVSNVFAPCCPPLARGHGRRLACLCSIWVALSWPCSCPSWFWSSSDADPGLPAPSSDEPVAGPDRRRCYAASSRLLRPHVVVVVWWTCRMSLVPESVVVPAMALLHLGRLPVAVAAMVLVVKQLPLSILMVHVFVLSIILLHSAL